MVGFEVLTAVSMKMAVFWVVAMSIALMMEAARTSETLVNFYQTTRRYNSEDSHLQVWMVDCKTGGTLARAGMRASLGASHQSNRKTCKIGLSDC
jgi:hypothetical protein